MTVHKLFKYFKHEHWIFKPFTKISYEQEILIKTDMNEHPVSLFWLKSTQ